MRSNSEIKNRARFLEPGQVILSRAPATGTRLGGTPQAATAKFRDGVCVYAQVDGQGSNAANKRVAKARAEAVRKFLLSKGVPAGSIKVGK